MHIAITGNIGSGKSEAIKFLTRLQFKCISSDKIISDFYNNLEIRTNILDRLNISQKITKKRY